MLFVQNFKFLKGILEKVSNSRLFFLKWSDDVVVLMAAWKLLSLTLKDQNPVVNTNTKNI